MSPLALIVLIATIALILSIVSESPEIFLVGVIFILGISFTKSYRTINKIEDLKQSSTLTYTYSLETINDEYVSKSGASFLLKYESDIKSFNSEIINFRLSDSNYLEQNIQYDTTYIQDKRLRQWAFKPDVFEIFDQNVTSNIVYLDTVNYLKVAKWLN